MRAELQQRQSSNEPPDPDGILLVVPAARELDPRELPIPRRAEKTLHRLGVQRLGDLDGVALSELKAVRNCGTKTVRDIQSLVRRANEGEFALTPETLQKATPLDFVVQIDEMLRRLPKRHLQIMTLRFGGGRHPPARLEAIGARFNLSRERVNQIVHENLRRFIRSGAPKTNALLDVMVASCERDVCPLTPGHLLDRAPKPWPLPYQPEFYLRAIAAMRPEIRLPAGIKAKWVRSRGPGLSARRLEKGGR
jgi:hypothetical protein